MLDAVAAVTTLHTFFGNNAAVIINSTTAGRPRLSLEEKASLIAGIAFGAEEARDARHREAVTTAVQKGSSPAE